MSEARNELDAGQVAWARRDAKVALSHFGRVLELVPESVQAWLGRGAACHALGELADAEYGYMQAVQLRPDIAEAWEALVLLELQGGAVAAELAREILEQGGR